MLHLVSGLPGHGKTLYTLWLVEQLRKETGRPVYVNGITNCTLPWTQLDEPEKWHELPDGAIVVIDEAYRIFPKRGPGSRTPTHVEQLATHRHRGFDLFLVTQHPSNQLDHFVRGLVGRHYHVRRVFGASRSRLYTWDCLGNHDDYHSRQQSIKSWFKFPTEVFGWYKSAEVHTIRRQLPWKVIGPAVAASALLVLCLYWASTALFSEATEEPATAQASPGEGDATNDAATNPFPSERAASSFSPASFSPTVEGIPYTVPAFAKGLKISQAPVISGCGVLKLGSSVKCKCNDQQGNIVDLDHRTCLAYFERGAFNPMGGPRYPDIEPYTPALAPPMRGDEADSRPEGGGGPAPGNSSPQTS